MVLSTPSSKLTSSVEDIEEKLNNLNKIKMARREEEITKFLIKKLIKFAQNNNNNTKEVNLYKMFFDDVMSEEDFNDIFSLSRQ